MNLNGERRLKNNWLSNFEVKNNWNGEYLLKDIICKRCIGWRWSSGLSTSSLFSFTAVSMVLRHRTSPMTSGVSPTSVRGGACARRQHPLSSFLHRGCPPLATVPFPWPRRECGTVCQISSRRQRRCPCSSDTWKLYCSRKATEHWLFPTTWTPSIARHFISV